MGERDEVPEAMARPPRSREAAPARLPRAPKAKDEDADDADLWIGSADSVPDDDGPRAAGPRTADGHRVFKIKTVSAFMDEIDRLARCLQDGDLARAADDEAGRADPASAGGAAACLRLEGARQLPADARLERVATTARDPLIPAGPVLSRWRGLG